MTKAVAPQAHGPAGVGIHFNLTSLVVFSVSLILASGTLVFVATGVHKSNLATILPTVSAKSDADANPAPATSTPWGELITSDVQLENPEEYLATDFDTNRPPTWHFADGSVDQVKAQLVACGLSATQIAGVLAPGRVTATLTNVALQPEQNLVLSLSSEVRGKLYGLLARNPANLYMRFPACFAGDAFPSAMKDSGLAPEVIALIKPLLYQRGSAQYFSDYEIVMQRVPSAEQRLRLLKALSRQPAVLARVRVRPTTDVDKLLGYWTAVPGVRVKDLRPLLESLKRLPDGGSASLLYFLPPFARERLFTYPMPTKAGDPAMDCHWSSLNFFNEHPDDRLGNPGYAATILTQNYYPVQKPSVYGDVIVLVDEKNNGLHSAVYLADDLVFTKNGNNYQQPWLLMRLNFLIARYTAEGNLRTLVYRQKHS